MHLNFIKEHRRTHYVNLLTSGAINQYLHQIDDDANARFDDLVTAYAKADGTDESLKARCQMRWGMLN